MKIDRHARRHPHPARSLPPRQPSLLAVLAAFVAHVLDRAAHVERIDVPAARPIRNDHAEKTLPLGLSNRQFKARQRRFQAMAAAHLHRTQTTRDRAEWQQRCNGGDAVRPGHPVRPTTIPAVA